MMHQTAGNVLQKFLKKSIYHRENLNILVSTRVPAETFRILGSALTHLIYIVPLSHRLSYTYHSVLLSWIYYLRYLSNGLFFFERCSLITATVCA